MNLDCKEKFIRILDVIEDEKIDVCIDVCFNRLDICYQNIFVFLIVFRGFFIILRVLRILKFVELRGVIDELVRRLFLEQYIFDLYYYSIFIVYSFYCQNKIIEIFFQEVFFDVCKMFINYVFVFFEEIFWSFFSIDVLKVIVEY